MNIRAVAEKAGVSVTTVSRVLNNPDLVAKNTREDVLKVMKDMNYTPNWFARNIQSNKTKIIGLLISDILNPSNIEILKGVEEIAHKKNYSVSICNTELDEVKEKAYLEMLISRNIDGIIFMSTTLTNRDLKVLKEKRVPFVLIDKNDSVKKANVVYTDCRVATKEAIEYLIAMGNKNIAIMLDVKAKAESAEKLIGYKEALEGKNIAIDDGKIVYCENTIEAGFVTTSKLLDNEVKIDAIFTGTDTLAFGVMEKIKQEGIKIPEEIALIGYDDLKVGAITEPKLTTIKKPTYRMGLLGSSLLFDLIEDHREKIEPQEIMVKSKLKIRKSCGNQEGIIEI